MKIDIRIHSASPRYPIVCRKPGLPGKGLMGKRVFD